MSDYYSLASNKFGDRREMETLASALAGNHTVTNLQYVCYANKLLYLYFVTRDGCMSNNIIPNVCL